MDTIYHRVLQFRCAETGRKFIVVFTRESQLSRFRVVNVIDERELSAQDESPATNEPLQLLAGSVRQFLAPFSSAVMSSTQLIQRIFNPVIKGTAEQPGEDPAPPPDPPSVENFNINDFDFTGWYCPYCGHAKDQPVVTRFVRCGRCHEYVCGARVEEKTNGQTYFACHDKCGNRGMMTGGSLSSLNGLGVDTQRPSRLEAGDRKLPAPRKALSSGNKDDR